MELYDLGLTNWYCSDCDVSEIMDKNLARVVTVNKDNYTLRDNTGEFIAEITGKLRFNAESRMDFPAVGDWVNVLRDDENSIPRILEILHRKTELKRKTAGKRFDYQMIATNINTAFIVQSLDNNFNINRMERYLTMIHESDIEAIILLSKKDLISEEELAQKIKEIRLQGIKEEILAFSNKVDGGIRNITDMLERGKTYCLLGSSGVGKTSLLNNIIGEERFETGEIREKDGKGRHVTTNRNLILLPAGGMIIDTPGMRELGNIEITEGIRKTFNEIEELANHCKFKNCTHTLEPQCAVLKAIEDGEISEEQYQSYMKLRKETRFNEMSYREKRKQDKNFGKMCKTIMAEKKSRKFDG